MNRLVMMITTLSKLRLLKREVFNFGLYELYFNFKGQKTLKVCK